MAEKQKLTKAGYKKLQDELEHLVSVVREEVKVFVRMGRSYILPAIAREISNDIITKNRIIKIVYKLKSFYCNISYYNIYIMCCC